MLSPRWPTGVLLPWYASFCRQCLKMPAIPWRIPRVCPDRNVTHVTQIRGILAQRLAARLSPSIGSSLRQMRNASLLRFFALRSVQGSHRVSECEMKRIRVKSRINPFPSRD